MWEEVVMLAREKIGRRRMVVAFAVVVVVLTVTEVEVVLRVVSALVRVWAT